MITEIIEDVESSAYVVFRCKHCTCVNVAWKDTEKYVDIMGKRILRKSDALCQNPNCSCHSSGGDLQGKLFDIGKEPPF